MPVQAIRERIKAVRKAVGLSQRAFCKGIFLSHSFYAQIESGAKNPNDRVYELLCNKYKVNKEWLLTGAGGMFTAPPPDMELEQLIEIYRELDPLFKAYIFKQIKQLLEVQKRGAEDEDPAEPGAAS